MKNKFIVALAFFLLLSVANVSAVSYYQDKSFVGDDISRVRTIYVWDNYNLVSNNIKSGNPLEAYLLYDIYPSSWNLANPDYSVDNCNITVTFSDHSLNKTSVLLSEVYTVSTQDDFRKKLFFQLDELDSILSIIDCQFSGTRPEQLEMPVSVSVVTPTWECKACQYYEWSKLNIDIQEAKTIGDNTSDIWVYIKQLVYLNYEILIALFWVFLISIALFGVSLIFVGVYWLYLYLKGVSNL